MPPATPRKRLVMKARSRQPPVLRQPAPRRAAAARPRRVSAGGRVVGPGVCSKAARLTRVALISISSTRFGSGMPSGSTAGWRMVLGAWLPDAPPGRRPPRPGSRLRRPSSGGISRAGLRVSAWALPVYRVKIPAGTARGRPAGLEGIINPLTCTLFTRILAACAPGTWPPATLST